MSPLPPVSAAWVRLGSLRAGGVPQAADHPRTHPQQAPHLQVETQLWDQVPLYCTMHHR